jgi:serine/threonine protein phosphatase PrpC
VISPTRKPSTRR